MTNDVDPSRRTFLRLGGAAACLPLGVLALAGSMDAGAGPRTVPRRIVDRRLDSLPDGRRCLEIQTEDGTSHRIVFNETAAFLWDAMDGARDVRCLGALLSQRYREARRSMELVVRRHLDLLASVWLVTWS
ncbi:MAG: PqqD family protein [Pseudomonadota bacterium]